MPTSASASSETTPAAGPAAVRPGDPSGGSEESQKFFTTHARFAATEPTGAFDNVLTSLRFSPRPYRFRDVLLGVGILYGAFIGLPVLAGIWAGWRIWLQVHHG